MRSGTDNEEIDLVERGKPRNGFEDRSACLSQRINMRHSVFKGRPTGRPNGHERQTWWRTGNFRLYVWELVISS